MSYTIKLTNNNTLTEIIDGTINQTSTDLTLVGKNSTGYGIYFNDNFVHLLENFANTSQPNNPITGQVWFDTTQNRLKVYDGTQFKVTGGTLVGATVPSSLTTGDIWINSATAQLYFNDGISNVLAGPLYTSSQGQSGFIVDTILDINKIPHTIVYLYCASNLLGIFASEAFTPATPISGYAGSVGIGFNVSSYNGVQFNVPVLTAQNLLGADGTTLYSADSFVATSGNSTISNGTLTIQNTALIPALVLGAGSNNEINASTTAFQIKSNTANQNFEIATLSSTGLTSAIYISAQNKFMGIFKGTPTAALDVTGAINATSTITTSGAISASALNVTSSYTPTSATSTGVAGQITWDANYVYVCIATNTWRRASLTTW
jgi:hypothetical protein